jgi:hypothetical protein
MIYPTILQETETFMDDDADKTTYNRMCPYVKSPFDDCHCASTSSLHTEATVLYCGGRFDQCEIYWRQRQAEDGIHGGPLLPPGQG